jgi:peptide/nickel transport system substrate-binding protein
MAIGVARSRKLLAVGAAVLALAGCSGGGSGSSGGAPVKGGTAVFAETPSTTPDYIFPYLPSAHLSVANIQDFQHLMYRPLYWFGGSGQPTVNYSLSLAKPPVFNGTKVTINLKHYLWSNGQPVTATDVMFWLNLELAEPASYGAYTGFPANVKDITVVSPTQLTMTMLKTYNPTWFLYNDLSQITPMPAAWDRTAAGPRHCATAVTDCAAVYSYLNAQAKNLNSYATSPLWSIVDGPWKLSAFSADGNLTMVQNDSYSGPVKPHLAQFKEVPFATDAAEYTALRSPGAGATINVGYLPQQNAPTRPAGAAVGSNPVKGYALNPWPVWGINYFAVNFQSTVSDHAAIIKQLYFRQALAYLMNQTAVIRSALHGYGAPTVGPVASNPVTSFLSPQRKAGNPYPYSPAKAKKLLTSHGWNVVPNGVTTCTEPAKCGPGISQGTGLSFSLPYATGVAWITSEMTQLQANAASVGIRLNLQPKPFDQVTAIAAGNCVVARLSCNWDIANWGGGWTFAPDYLPTGEQLFQTGAVANSGGYSSQTNDLLIARTLTSRGNQPIYTWQNYLAAQLPMLWQPNADYQLTEVSSKLRGVLPQSPTLSITPENWYFVK